MKKTVTLFLLFVFLLNVLGFYGVFLGLKLTNSINATRAIDAQRYAAEETITIKVPLTVPYYTASDAEFQRVDGEFAHNGNVYRMIKQKLQNDTLYVVCLADQKGKEINASMREYVKTFASPSTHGKHPDLKAFSFIKDFVPTSIAVECDNVGWNKLILFSDNVNHRYNSYPVDIFSPPKPALG